MHVKDVDGALPLTAIPLAPMVSDINLRIAGMVRGLDHIADGLHSNGRVRSRGTLRPHLR